MANANSPMGFRPVRTLAGVPYNGQFTTYSIPSGDGTATFIGDPVKLAGTGSTVNGQVYTDVIQGASGTAVVGVVVGFAPDPTDLSVQYRKASTARLVYVCDDPNMLFEVQDVTGGTPIAINDLGLNVNFTVNAGSTTTGLSGVVLDNTSEATTNTLDCKLIAAIQREDNAQGSDASKWLVKLNKHRYADQLAGV